jgi:hypothetical protein
MTGECHADIRTPGRDNSIRERSGCTISVSGRSDEPRSETFDLVLCAA